jgi:hypothetical protein
MRTTLTIIAVLFSTTVFARELYPGQYAQVDPAVKEWFGKQRAPNSKIPCCSDADGTQADEERHDNAIWVQFTYIRYVHAYDGDVNGVPTKTRSAWMQVPEDAIIRGGENPTGNPVVWYRTEGRDGEVVKIRCYKPAIDG